MMSFPGPYDFYFELPIYNSIDFGKSEFPSFFDLVNFRGNIDAYNPFLKENTTFSVKIDDGFISAHPFNNVEYFFSTRKAVLTCLRSRREFEIYFKITKIAQQAENEGPKYSLIKIGQYPSIADIHKSKIKNYSKVLDSSKMNEFAKAIGLGANGVGIGSFVYLRRIFESLLSDAHNVVKNEPTWNEKKYSEAKVNEKIELLKSELPDFLVEHKEIYGILSKGIHELEENECLNYFFTVKIAIELILDEKLEKHNAAQRKIEASKAIQSIKTNINQKKK